MHVEIISRFQDVLTAFLWIYPQALGFSINFIFKVLSLSKTLWKLSAGLVQVGWFVFFSKVPLYLGETDLYQVCLYFKQSVYLSALVYILGPLLLPMQLKLCLCLSHQTTWLISLLTLQQFFINKDAWKRPESTLEMVLGYFSAWPLDQDAKNLWAKPACWSWAATPLTGSACPKNMLLLIGKR